MVFREQSCEACWWISWWNKGPSSKCTLVLAEKIVAEICRKLDNQHIWLCYFHCLVFDSSESYMWIRFSVHNSSTFCLWINCTNFDWGLLYWSNNQMRGFKIKRASGLYIIWSLWSLYTHVCLHSAQADQCISKSCPDTCTYNQLYWQVDEQLGLNGEKN